MRIIHTADWHLGRSLHGINLIEDQTYILQQFVELVKDSQADAVIIAGDVFDRSQPPVDAVRLLNEVLTELCLVLKVPTIMIAGNHDNPDRLAFAQQLLANGNLHTFGPLNDVLNPVVLVDTTGPVYFCPIPYADLPFIRSFTNDENIHDHEAGMKAMVSYIARQVPRGSRAVAIAHAFIDGGQESDSERPLSALGGAGRVSATLFKPFHYTALGHLHRPQNIGMKKVCYSGSLLKYSFAEASHPKSVNVIDMDAKGKVKIDCVSLAPRHDLRCLEGTFDDVLKGPEPGERADDYLKVILTDEGPLLDPMGRLRQVYPNLLEVQRTIPGVNPTAILGPDRDFRKLSNTDLFASFYEQVTNKELPDDAKNVVARLLEGFYRREREVGA